MAMTGLATGSHHLQDYDEHRPSTRQSVSSKICRVCGDEIGVKEDGQLFVGCHVCGFPVCRPCYEYERSEGNQSCPQCNTRYKRHKGLVGFAGKWGLCSKTIAYWRSILYYRKCGRSKEIEAEREMYSNAEWKERVEKWKVRQEKRGLVSKDDGGNDQGEEDEYLMAEARQPLWRKLPIASSKINPYRIVIVIRLVVLGFFLRFRILTPAYDAFPLWLISVICEIWFALSWILDQFPKWFPIERETYLDRLSMRFEREGEPNRLSPVDFYVSTVDPLKEPPIITANTVLSILAVDYR
ncbi:hypothetical protein GH714_026782 [Hevea brasiliensis]|uniref:Cellulose synthase n=1 Tax=Hevea brasiliensis TaxID=3981 RepID=A0A6A6KVP1_HEVBR|nr:hypothetical protein GH714_026782 [Hevea brasiliensis]